MKKSIIILLHAAYWLTYLTLVGFIVRMAPGFRHSNLFHILFYSHVTVSAIVPCAGVFYSFYGIGFRFLRQKKVIVLTAFGVSASLVIGLLTFATLGFFLLPHLFRDNGPAELIKMIIFLSLLNFIHGILGLVMRGFVVSYGDIRVKEDLNRKNYEIELALVKSQVNPHFLFNTIHNIDVLIGQDAIKASAYLNKLSDIMRFMLYETKTDKIELSKELSYIEKYIDLQKIRTSNPKYVNYSVEGDTGDFLIEPMLFIPFIENAFKHAENKKIENAINIRFSITKEQILFDCENHYSASSQRPPHHGGLGNGLIQKRLGLLYPGSHRLEMGAAAGIFKAKLILFK